MEDSFTKYCTYKLRCDNDKCSSEFPLYLTCRKKLEYDISAKEHADWTAKHFSLVDKLEE